MSEVMEQEVETVAVAEKGKRVRKVQKHQDLERAISGLQSATAKQTGVELSVTLARSAEKRYARAVFDMNVQYGDGRTITVRNRTVEELQSVVRGMRLMLDLQRA